MTDLKDFHRELLKAQAAGYTRLSYVCRDEEGRCADANPECPLWVFLTPKGALSALGKSIASTGKFQYEFLS